MNRNSTCAATTWRNGTADRVLRTLCAVIACIIVLGLGGKACSLRAQERAPETLTLREALELAAEHSPLLSSRRLLAESARHKAQAARDDLLPRVDASAGALADDSEEKKLIARSELAGLNREQTFNSRIYDVQLTLSYPIVAARPRRQANAEESAAEAAAFDAAATRQRLFLAVARRYYGALLVERSVEAARFSVKALEETRRVVEKLLDAGRVPPLHLVRIDTRLSKVRLELVRLNNERRQRLVELQALLGVHIPERAELEGAATGPRAEIGSEESVRFALQHRPELQAAEASVAQAKRLQEAVGATFIPRVNLAVSGARFWGDDAPEPVDDFFVGVRIKMPLFEPSYGAQKSRAASRVAALALKKRQLENDIRAEVLAADLDVEEALESLEVVSKTVALAREGLRVERRRFATGRSTVNDVLQAQSDLLEAQLARARARLRLDIAAAERFRARGDASIENLAPAGRER